MRSLFFALGLIFSVTAHGDTLQKMEGTFKDTVTLGALDKVTARTSDVTLKVGETIKIGTLMVRAIRAWTSNPSEIPESKVFFEITEIKTGQPFKMVFNGWMFASNPSVSALEHPVYDIWVKDVKGQEISGDIPQSGAIDEATSEKIDDLMDQLMDPETDDLNSAFEVIEGMPDSSIKEGRVQTVHHQEQDKINKEALSPSRPHNTIDVDLKHRDEQ